MAQQVTYEQLKEKYMQLFQRNKKLKAELEKCVNNQKVLEAGIKERDDAIEERSKSISELLKAREELVNELNSLKQQVHDNVQPPETDAEAQETLGELASAFNTERRELLTEIGELKKNKEELINERDEISRTCKSMENRVSELERANENLRMEVGELIGFKQEAENAANSSEDSQKQLLLRISEIEALKRRLKECEGEHRSECEKLTGQISRLQGEARVAAAYRDELQSQKEKMDGLVAVAKEYEELKRQFQYMKMEVERKEREGASEKEQWSAMSATQETEITALKQQLYEKETKVRDYSSQLAMVSAKYEQQCAVLKELNGKMEEQGKQLSKFTLNSQNDSAIMTEQTKKLNALNDEVRQLRDKLTLAATTVETQNKAMESMRSAQEQERHLNEKLKGQLAAMEKNYNDLIQRGSEKDATMETLRAELAQVKVSSMQNSMDADSSKKEIDRLKKKAKDLKVQLEEKESQISKLQHQNRLDQDSFGRRETQLNAMISALEESNKSAKHQAELAHAQLQKMKTEFENREQTNFSLEEEMRTLELQAKTHMNEIAELKAALQQSEQDRNEKDSQIAKLMKDRRKHETSKRDNDQKLAKLLDENKRLSEKISALETDQGHSSKSPIFPDYLRKVLLEFFIQDGSTRKQLIPVILNLVQCDEKQVNQAVRYWADSNQIISHALALFRK